MMTSILCSPDRQPLLRQVPYAYPEAITFWDGNKRGSRRMMRDIFECFAATDHQRLLYCEDDIVIDQNLFLTASDIVHSYPLISFYDPRIADRRRFDPPLLEMSSRGFRFTQCLLLERATVEAFLDIPFDNSPRTKSGCSIMIRRLLIQAGFPLYGLFLPNQAQHLGAESIVNRSGNSAAKPSLTYTPSSESL